MRVLDIACWRRRVAHPHGGAPRDLGCGRGRLSLGAWNGHRPPRRTLPDADLTFVQADGKDYVPPEGEGFDVVSLVGASWIWDGYAGHARSAA